MEKAQTTTTKDPICGMTVDQATALSAAHEGKMTYFCSEHCRQKFLSMPPEKVSASKTGSCCG